MKYKIVSHVTALAGVLLFGILAPVFGENIFPEGSMEILNRKGLPDGLSHADPEWAKKFGGKVTVETEEGNSYLRLVMPATDQLFASGCEIKLPANATQVRVAYRVRANITEVAPNTEKTGTGGCVIRGWSSAPIGTEGAQGKFSGADWIKESTDGWMEKEFTFDTVPGMPYLVLQLGFKQASGTIEFDDVVIEPSF